METLEIFRNRYTTKEYNAGVRIQEAKLLELKQIMQLSPSSINSQPWEFVFAEGEEVRGELAGVSMFNDQKVRDCSCVVVLRQYANVEKWEQWMAQNLPQPAQDYYSANVKPKGNGATMCWFKNQVYLALGVLLSSCAMIGIDSTPMEGIEILGYDKILDGISGKSDYKTVVAVALGVRNAEDFNQLDRKPKTRRDFSSVITTL